jgi:hypothetical protein
MVLVSSCEYQSTVSTDNASLSLTKSYLFVLSWQWYYVSYMSLSKPSNQTITVFSIILVSLVFRKFYNPACRISLFPENIISECYLQAVFLNPSAITFLYARTIISILIVQDCNVDIFSDTPIFVKSFRSITVVQNGIVLDGINMNFWWEKWDKLKISQNIFERKHVEHRTR